jgi:transcription elongation factor Elf1
MSLIGHGIAKTLGRKRTCPVCKRPQVVAQGKARETVKCKFCGADIPAKNPRIHTNLHE